MHDHTMDQFRDSVGSLHVPKAGVVLDHGEAQSNATFCTNDAMRPALLKEHQITYTHGISMQRSSTK